jgi:hypothetical protein
VGGSSFGRIGFRLDDTSTTPGARFKHWMTQHKPTAPIKKNPPLTYKYFSFKLWRGDYGVPHWFLALIFGTLAVAPWFRQLTWKFSLRTLLIVTTLIALMLGLLIWASS